MVPFHKVDVECDNAPCSHTSQNGPEERRRDQFVRNGAKLSIKLHIDIKCSDLLSMDPNLTFSCLEAFEDGQIFCNLNTTQWQTSYKAEYAEGWGSQRAGVCQRVEIG